MGAHSARRQKEDDYFNDPDYDKLSDEELDDLYNFGEIRSASTRQKPAKKAASKKTCPPLASDEDENWLDIDLEEDEDLYDDY